MKTPFPNLVRFLSVLSLAIWAACPRAVAQTSAQLDLGLYAGLTVTGTVGTVYSIEYVTELAQTNNPSAWRAVEFLQLPAGPYLWADKSAPATGKRFYRAVVFDAPTNMVFIPPGTFMMGSPTNEVDRYDNEGPQTAVPSQLARCPAFRSNRKVTAHQAVRLASQKVACTGRGTSDRAHTLSAFEPPRRCVEANLACNTCRAAS